MHRHLVVIRVEQKTHTPEVLRFYPAQENDNSAFGLNHPLAHLESDEAQHLKSTPP